MLRAKVLPEVLSQIVGNGIDASMLMTLDGALMGSVGDMDQVEPKVVGAIASHTWGEYLHSSKEFQANDDLRFILVELEVVQNGRLGIAPAGKGFLLCAYSNGDAQAGFLKAKLETLGQYLSTSLDQIQV
ncbi:TPA: hypothetical protein N0F65_007132 [Lagenidium giganteum]|uniref:Roadblock/LAMTOR2 domain-containing protein n=1 Tax=Lagenidium giganteum TaxID=4803 RepID=A0AAV2YW11_9STRA|nr:TPA: hypothetical protein N0F65_007132 [Lagenidium giganteum]